METKSGADPDRRRLSDIITEAEVRTGNWCFTDLAGRSGFSLTGGAGPFLHAVTYGSIRISLTSGETLDIQAGEAVIVLAGHAHAIRSDRDAPARAHDVLNKDGPVSMLATRRIGEGRGRARVLSGRLQWAAGSGVELSNLVTTIHVRARGGDGEGVVDGNLLCSLAHGDGAGILLTRCASLMIAERLRDHICKRGELPPSPQNAVRHARQLITDALHENWSVSRLAKAVSMSRSSFAAHFAEQTGVTPIAYLLEQRMKRAKAMLGEANLPIWEIGERVGYSSEAAFTRRFTKFAGISPTNFRSRVKDISGRRTVQSRMGLLAGKRPVAKA